jgi:acetate kinase
VSIQRRHVAVINTGSSSVKLDLFAMPSEDLAFSARVERVGKPGTRLVTELGNHTEEREVPARDAAEAVDAALDALDAAGFGVEAVGHRVVHGGARFVHSVLIDAEVIAAIEACVPLAPLHNPANLTGIARARERKPALPHVAMFDTAFHQTLTPEAYLYAIPRRFHDEDGVRRYGFHGTSHRYVAERAAAYFQRPPETLRLVTLHLGNGCSACAIDGGRSVDTSMGMTPLEGLAMGTRSGDVDPAVVLRLVKALGLEQAERVLNHESGLLGVSRGKSNDMRDLLRAAGEGDADAELAVKLFCRRVKKMVGAYAAALGGLDAVVFTGGIGENAAAVRKQVCSGLEVVGALLDDRKNEGRGGGERDIASLDSRVRILVIPTDEELAIARDTARLAGFEATRAE